jgi:DNA-3-methyladenine glycosylase
MTVLPLVYYRQHDALTVSKDLLGKFLLTAFNGVLTGGMIVETEAYCAPEDRASHAHQNRRTKRNAVMFHAGGICYVYLCYGIHALFNVVVYEADIPHVIRFVHLKL